MFEARVGEEELSPPQRRHVLLRLKRMVYGQRRHKFKGILPFDRREKMLRPLLVKIRNRFWSCQIFGMSEEGIFAISAVCLVAGKFLRGPPNLRLPAPFLQMVLARGQVLWPPELWACESIEEETGSWSSSQPLLCATSSALSYSLVFPFCLRS